MMIGNSYYMRSPCDRQKLAVLWVGKSSLDYENKFPSTPFKPEPLSGSVSLAHGIARHSNP